MKNEVFKACIAIASVLGAGCAQNKPMTFSKEGATQQEYKVAKYECERDLMQTRNMGTGFAANEAARTFLMHCMEAHGYELTAAKPRSGGAPAAGVPGSSDAKAN